MKKTKPIFRIGAGKGKLLPVLEEFLNFLGHSIPSDLGRRLTFEIEADKYILEVITMRWPDIVKNRKEFDIIIYGTDQWLESGHKSMIALQYFNQKNCRLSLLVPKKMLDMDIKDILTKSTIATTYTGLAEKYLGIAKDRIFEISGSTEAAVHLGWADCVFDLVESGETAKANELFEKKSFVNLGAVVATTKPEKISSMVDCGLTTDKGDSTIVAVEGNEGTGKSTIAKHLVQNGIFNKNAAVLVAPYSGDVGKQADSLRASGHFTEWMDDIGVNHWRAPFGISAVYDRSILTGLTELIRNNVPDEEICKIVSFWKPLPELIFLCDNEAEVSCSRVESRKDKDEFDSLDSLRMYRNLYLRAVEWVRVFFPYLKIVILDTSKSIEEVLEEVEITLKKKEII